MGSLFEASLPRIKTLLLDALLAAALKMVSDAMDHRSMRAEISEQKARATTEA